MSDPEQRDEESRDSGETAFEKAAEQDREERERAAEQLEREPPLEERDD